MTAFRLARYASVVASFVGLISLSALEVQAAEEVPNCADCNSCSYYSKVASDARKVVSTEKKNLNYSARLHQKVSSDLKISYPKELRTVENERLRNQERNRRCEVTESRYQAKHQAQKGKEDKACHGFFGTLFGSVLDYKKCERIEFQSRKTQANYQAQKRICDDLTIYVNAREQVLLNRQTFIQQLSDLRQANVTDAYVQFVGLTQQQLDYSYLAYDKAVVNSLNAAAKAEAACSR